MIRTHWLEVKRRHDTSEDERFAAQEAALRNDWYTAPRVVFAAMTMPPLALKTRPLSRWPVLVSVLSIAAILTIVGGLLYDARRQVEIRTRETSWNLLRVLQRDIGHNVDILSLSLQALIEGLSQPDTMALPPEIRDKVLFDRSAAATGVGALIVFDEQEVIKFASTPVAPHWVQTSTDRDYFEAQRQTDAGLFISRPYLSRLIGKEVVGLSRRWSHPDGSFAGIALATIQVAYLKELFSSLHLTADTVLTLVRTDGSVILRLAQSGFQTTGNFADSPVFQALRERKAGHYLGRSRADNVERLYSFTRVGELPLIMTIGISTASIYGEWMHKSLLVLTALVLISGLLVALCIRLADELGRRAEAEARLVAANADLERLSTTDALTGLGNRRLFDDALAREARRAERTNTPLSLILLDVDAFKLFNDRYGHPKGDQALRSVAAVLHAHTRRPGDLAFRIGGEEFAIILAGKSAAEAARVMAAIQRDLRLCAIAHTGSATGTLTVSQGAAEVQAGDGCAAIQQADSALYRAKHDGRDRAYMHSLLAA